MRKALTIVIAALALSLGGVAAVAADPGNGKGNGPPATVPGSPGDDCSHGNSGKPCRPDPQPTHGKDCDDHGNARGNEDHCAPTETTPTDTTPTDTTPTTPTDTTPTDTTPVDTTPVDTTPEDKPSTTVPESTPGPAPAPESAPSAPGSVASPTRPKTKAAKAKAAKAKVTIVKVSKPKPNGVVVVTTADGKRHTAVMGSG